MGLKISVAALKHRKLPKMTERKLQAQVFEFLRLALPDTATAFAIPNGDGRVTFAPGTLAGIPDLCVVFGGKPLFIELKTAKGAVRPAQRWVRDRLTAAGAIVTICRSVEAVEEFLAQHIPLKASLKARAA